MLPISEKTIRTSFINASQRERKDLHLPPSFETLDWANLDYLGWRDEKFVGQGYVFVELDGEPQGILLRAAEAKTRSRPQCAWCEDVTLPNDVQFFTTKRAGDSGRRGNVIGTLVCSNFECSRNVRKRPPVAYIGFDVDAAITKRIEALGENVRNFVRNVRDSA